MFFYNDIIGNTLSYAEENGYKLLTKEEEFDLIERAQSGDKDAEETLIFSNVRLVASCVNQYKSKCLTKDDLFQEGLFGLYDAIEKFNVDLGHRFSTYATWLIKHRITRTISNKDRVVRIPVYITDNIAKVIRAERELITMGVDNPTIEDISEATGIDEVNVKRAYANMEQAISIDTPVYGNDGSVTTLEDFIIAQETVDSDEIFEDLYKDTMKDHLMELLEEVLSERELSVIFLRYGLGEEEYTLLDISKKFKVSEERIRQIERGALKKLRNSNKSSELMSFLLN